jgi:hypothetical protein
VFKFINFRFRLFTPPLGDFQDARRTQTRTSQRESTPTSNAVSSVILLHNIPIMKMTRNKNRNGRRKRTTIGRQRVRRTLAKNGTHSSSSDSNDEGLAAFAFDKSSLFPNEHQICLMAKEKKVRTRDNPKYTSSSDEESDDDVDYSYLFKGLDRSKVDKINELINALNEKDRLLEKQEDILYEEHDKLVNAEKYLALEVKRNEFLSSELSSCNDSISILKNLITKLNAKLEKVNVASSTMEHVVICNRCKGFDINACNGHASTILKLNNDVANLSVQLKICKSDYEKLKFARDAYTIGGHPSIEDGLGFQKGTKNLTSQRTSNLNKEKGKAPMASSSHSSHDKKNHANIYTHVKTVHHERCYNHVVYCHTWVSRAPRPGREIIIRCARTKSHTYDE